MIEIERYVKFIVKHKLTQPQFLFLYLLQRKRYDLLKMYGEAFPSDDGKVIGVISRNDLLERGFIIKLDEMENAASYTLGKAFKDIFIDKFEASEMLKDLYPAHGKYDGKIYPLTIIDTYELAPLYGERIGYEVAEHNEVMLDLQYGIENNLVKMKLENFVRSEYWKALRRLRLNTEVPIETDEISY